MIVVTAPTSAIGRQVLAHLLTANERVRVIARDPAKIPQATRERVEVIEGSHGDAAVLDRSFVGADAVFWLIPPNPKAESLQAGFVEFTRPACEAFGRHGIKHVVGISGLGRNTPVADQAGYVTASLRADDLIAASGVHYRALTMPSFMDNLLRHVALIRDQGVFMLANDDDRRAPSCATRDIAVVAARLLRDRSWTGVGSVPVLGPEDISFNEMATIMSEVLGRPVRYQQVPYASIKERLLGFGATEAMAQGMVDMITAKNAGLDNGEVRTAENSTPTSFRQWCTEMLKPAVLA